jgi:hypothetical protein
MFLSAVLAVSLATPRLILAHYMPWYAAKPFRQEWGWHWTMGKFDVDKPDELASQFRPMIGPYDSQDPDVIEYQLLTMKTAGIDGVLIDWYGIDDLYDYPEIHRASELVFSATKRLGMKFGVVYEDQTVKHLIEKGKLKPENAVEVGTKTMTWLAKNWFSSPHYVKVNDKPALLVFGPQYFKPQDWRAMMSGINVTFYTLHHRIEGADGAYDWPLPGGGTSGCEKERLAFVDRAKEYSTSITSAYPRFADIYKQAGVGNSYGTVEDLDGQTYYRTLKAGLEGTAPIVQITTWNDWGEGTQIEPSKEFGYRDLEATQDLRKKYLDKWFNYKPSDLRLPERLFRLRKKGEVRKGELDRAATMIVNGECDKAAKILNLNR